MDVSNFESKLEELIKIDNHPVFEKISIFINKPFHRFNFFDCKSLLEKALEHHPDFPRIFFAFLESNGITPDTLELSEHESDAEGTQPVGG